MIKRILAAVALIVSICMPLSALTSHEVEMFTQLEQRWNSRYDQLLEQRSAVSVDDPKYVELSKDLVKAQYWSGYYQEAQIDKSSWWNIITNTITWTVNDLIEIATIMWENNDDLLEKIYTGKWADLMRDTVDGLMRQKLRASMRSHFGGNTYSTIENHIFTNFISPKLSPSLVEQLADKAFSTAKDGLKDAYVNEVKRHAKGLDEKGLTALGGKLAEQVGGAVDAAEFTIDMAQKYVLWQEAQPAVESMLSHIQQIATREKCSHLKAFDIYLGKEQLTVPVEVKTEPPPPPTVVKTVTASTQITPSPVEEQDETETIDEASLIYGSYRFASVDEAKARHFDDRWTTERYDNEIQYYDESLGYMASIYYTDDRCITIESIDVGYGSIITEDGTGRHIYNFTYYDDDFNQRPSLDGRAISEVHVDTTREISVSRYETGGLNSYRVKPAGEFYFTVDYSWDRSGRLLEDDDTAFWENFSAGGPF